MRILVVDDDPLVRMGIRAVLGSEQGWEVVGEASDGDEAIERCNLHRPDVVLMDIRMPGTDGLVATRRIVAEMESPPRVLILTTFELDDYVYEALRAGASGFVLKRVPPTELIGQCEWSRRASRWCFQP